MEAVAFSFKTPTFCPIKFQNSPCNFTVPSIGYRKLAAPPLVLRRRPGWWSRIGCVESGTVAELGRELEAEEEEEWMRMGRVEEKCKERKGVVELLECLEREAIMGDDHGRDPTDYHRRAHIFDKSSRVFQALKERQSSSLSQ